MNTKTIDQFIDEVERPKRRRGPLPKFLRTDDEDEDDEKEWNTDKYCLVQRGQYYGVYDLRNAHVLEICGTDKARAENRLIEICKERN